MTKSEIFYSIIYKKNKMKNENKIEGLVIDKVVMNSNDIEKGDLFIAIRGGNNFVNEALLKGAAVVYDNEDISISENRKDKAFFVEDSVAFIQEFAEKWRKNLNLKVVGITGSNGKTTVKDMIYHLLSKKYNGKKTEGNYNNHIGLPFTLLRAEKNDEFIILEMGMSGFHEIDLLGRIAEPDIGIITNIGESHLEFLKTKENVFKAKTEIIPHIKKTLIINGDDEYLKDICNNEPEIIKILKKGDIIFEVKDFSKEKSDFYYGDIFFDEKAANFTLQYYDRKNKKIAEEEYKTNVLGEHNILNLSIAIATAKEFNMKKEEIKEAVKDIVMTDMRFQKIEKGKTVYINDAYNASPMSMKKSLETFSKLYNDKEKIVVLGDMLELGEKEKEFHENIFDTLKGVNVQRVYLYGNRMKNLYNRLKENADSLNKIKIFEYFGDKNEIKIKISEITAEKAVLLKASRGMKLEEVMED